MVYKLLISQRIVFSADASLDGNVVNAIVQMTSCHVSGDYVTVMLQRIWVASGEKCLRACAVRSRSFCACAKYHPGYYPFIHSVVSNDSVSGQ